MTIKPLEFSIEDLLIEGGLLNATFVNHRGEAEPTPTVQLFEFVEEDLADGERCIMIRNSGSGSGNFLVREPAMTIAVFSKAMRGDIGATKHYIELVKEYISRVYQKDCIMSVNIIGDTAGPYPLDSGRRVFELNLNVITDTGESL